MTPEKTKRKPTAARLAASVLLAAALIAPPLAASAAADFRPMGEGRLAWFGVDLYTASLAAPQGTYVRGQPAELSIEYLKPIRADRLVDRTRKEWDRLQRRTDLPARALREEWLTAITTIWPDVTPGDTITTRVDVDGSTRFLLNGAEIGAIEDPRFGPAFLDIWLHPETRSGSLRADLLGQNGNGR